MRTFPSFEWVNQILRYDPETGLLTWKIDRANVRAGTVAGSRSHVYVVVGIDTGSYRAHQLAWLLMTGKWPAFPLDHINTDKQDNRWSNLRRATKSLNMANRPAQRNSASGLKGAYYYKAYRRWQSTIQKDGRTIYLGYFDTAEEAHAAYCKAAHALYGEFSHS